MKASTEIVFSAVLRLTMKEKEIRLRTAIVFIACVHLKTPMKLNHYISYSERMIFHR